MSLFPFKVVRENGFGIGRPSFLRRPNFQDKIFEIEVLNKRGEKTIIEQPYITLLSHYFLTQIGWISNNESDISEFYFEDVDIGFKAQIKDSNLILKNFDGKLLLNTECWRSLKATFEELKKQIKIATLDGRLDKSEISPLVYSISFNIKDLNE